MCPKSILLTFEVFTGEVGVLDFSRAHAMLKLRLSWFLGKGLKGWGIHKGETYEGVPFFDLLKNLESSCRHLLWEH